MRDPTRRSPLATDAAAGIWVEAARALGFEVRRGASAYASSDGRGTITIGDDASLDGDDALAQLVFHELMHAITEGPEGLDQPDWGLDNQTDRDVVREHGCLRLSAHLADRYGLRAALAPTTDYRPYHDALPVEPLAASDDDAAVRVAQEGLRCLDELGWRDVIEGALAATAKLLERHPTGLPRGDGSQTCGTCAWRYFGGRGTAVDRCRQAALPRADGPRVGRDLQACARWEPALDCQTCGACCREAYHSVTVSMRDPVVWKHPHLIMRSARRFEIERKGERCAALEGGGDRPFACGIYEDRPAPCREFERGGRHCLDARRRVGLSPGHEGGAR